PTVITITEENYAEWFKLDDAKRLKFVSGSNGAKTFYIEYLPTNITMLDLYTWYSTSWDTSQYTFIGKNNFNLTNVKLRAWGANVLISNMTLYYDEDYENSGDSFSYYIFIESDYDFVPGSSFVLDNIKINYTGKYLENYHAGVLCTGENQPGVTYQNFEINAKMLSVPDGNELIILERNDKFINSTVNIVENYATADETSITGIKVNSKSVTIKDNNITLTGESTLTAIKLNSNNNTITNNNITVTTTGTANGVELTGNDNTVTDNYILANNAKGDAAVVVNGENNVVKDNIPSVVITENSYSTFFDENSVLREEYNGEDLFVSGLITGKVFIFDGVNVTITNDGTAELKDCQIMVGNDAQVVFDGLVINNEDMEAILLESSGNVINNSEIIVTSAYPLHAVEIAEDGNIITNTIITATIASADVAYDKDYVGLPQSSALYISSNNNLLDNITVSVDGTSVAEGSYYPSIDAIDFQSTGKGVVIENNTITNSKVIATGSNYVYGINVGRAKDTTIENVNIDVESDYYTNGIQLFDAVDITIDGTIDSTADTQAYGVYATAMAVGTSSGIDLTGLNITVEAPDATGVLIEGASDVIIADATYDINGGSTTAVNAHVDWMGNIPKNINITGMDINIDGTEDNSILYFGLCDGVTITECNIETTSGSEINFNKTSNAQVTNNYILIKDMMTGSFGNYAVITTENDTTVENNTPTSKLIDELNQQIEDLQNELDQLKAPKTTTLTLDPITDAKYNTNITITGTLVNEDSIGLYNQIITLTIGEKTVDVTTKGGVFEYTTSFKTLEEQTVTATYAGTDKYNASEDTITFTLEKGDVIVTVDEIAETTYGDNVTITGKFTTSDGKAITNSNVKITINGKKYYAKTDKTGTYTLSVKTTTVGENTITAGYSGNTNYNAYETTATFNVKAADAVVTYEPISDVTLGDNVTITGTFTDANGKAVTNSNVKITINGKKYYAKTDSTGKYTLSVATTKEGVNNVTIGYSGSAKYNAFETSTTFTVLKKA
ncbi:MAG: Ig-like domain-containing protein, partial [Methanosphaera sp.]|nr:Ig-like domain-containing protein [Methanosphaera sp.]